MLELVELHDPALSKVLNAVHVSSGSRHGDPWLGQCCARQSMIVAWAEPPSPPPGPGVQGQLPFV